MSKVKKDLIKEINKKAQKIRDKRVSAANNKSLEDAAFDFFKNIEESRVLHGGMKYDNQLFRDALRSLKERVKGFDQGTKVSVEFNAGPEDQHVPWESQTVRGVTIWWSQAYIMKNNVDPSLYIDISSMLFF
jgi:hypothetical protein